MISDERYHLSYSETDFVPSGKYPALVERLLFTRGMDTPEKIERFLHPSVGDLHDPMLLADMDKAVLRVRRAIEQKEKITVYGDYDADGVTATAVLVRYLLSKDAAVDYYIPHRESEGYGIHADAIEKLHGCGTSLVLTVDTGVTATVEIELAGSLGMDVVVTDHHTCIGKLPDAVAVVNPTRPDNAYPFAGLAGVGVAFKLLCAIEAGCQNRDIALVQDEMLNLYGDLVALGTVADVMPMLDENRYIVQKGLQIIEKTENKGLLALLEASFEGKNTKLTSQSIGFAICPKINAAGRMAHADLAAKLFLTNDSTDAKGIAASLLELNRERQQIENEIVTLATRQIYSLDLSEDAVLVLGDEGWHPGVLGIAASRIAERYGKPAFLVSFDGEDGKGSVRAAGDFDVMDALGSCADLLLKFGGHAAAAGLSVRREDFSELRRRLNAYALQNVGEKGECDVIATADFAISVYDTCYEVASALQCLQPFGNGNEQPVFLLSDCKIEELAPLSGGKHTRMTVSRDGIFLRAPLFGKTLHTLPFVPGDCVDLFCYPELNTFGRMTTVQLSVKKMFPSYGAYREIKGEKDRFLQIMQGDEEMHDFPLRADFAAVYRFLSRCEQGEISYRYLLSALAGLSYPALCMILEIFKQAKLLQYQPDRTGETFRFSILKVEEKVNIEQTPLYRRYNPHFE